MIGQILFPKRFSTSTIPPLTSTTSRSSVGSLEVKGFDKIPGPPRIPIFGNLYLYKLGYYNVFEYHKVLEDLYKRWGPVVREDIGSRTIIHVFSPDDVQLVHASEGKIPIIPPLQETTQLYRQKRDLSLGLGNTNGEEWYKLRSAVQQMMLRPKEVSHYLPKVDDVARAFVAKIERSLDSHQVLPELRTLVAKWSLESAGMICFDKRLGCLDEMEKEDLAEAMIEANKDIFVLGGLLKFSLPIFKYISTPKWTRFLKAEDFFYSNATRFVDETIDCIREESAKGELNASKYNFLNYLLSRRELTRKDVTIITLSLFADGLSTTTPAMIFNLYTLAKNPEVQDKLYEEVKGCKDIGMRVGDLNGMGLLKACVKETFRLYPIGTEVSRNAGTDLVLGGYKIPKGTHVDLNQSIHFRSESYFPRPKAFLPERWLRDGGPGTTTLSRHPYLLIPFGHGVRMCAGRRFAEQDLYVALARIVQRFRLELDSPEEAELGQVYNTLMFPDRPVKLRFIKRC